MDVRPSSSKDTTAVQTDNSKVQKKSVLPLEYDEHDSRWTLKYNEPAPGLRELMEHSGVYVDADKLDECEKNSNDCKTFARMLLTEIFTTNALSTCTWTSETTNDSDIHSGQARPGLDEHAKEILLMYVQQFGISQNWNITDYQCCVNSMRHIILEMRRDRQTEENYFDEVMENFSPTHFRQTMMEMLQKEEEDVRDKFLGEGSRTSNWIPPPEYNENDSRWTLQYREPAPGLVELMPQSGVFVNADKLALSVLISNDSITLARKLLAEIFTTSALQTCSWTGPTDKDSYHGGTNARPALNENAMKTLLNFVAEFELENDLILKTENKYIKNLRRQQEVQKLDAQKEHTSSSPAKLEEKSKLQNSYAITDENTSLSKYFVTEFPKLNEDLTEQKDHQNDKHKYIFPPENDSRWTLKYREPAPGLVELIEDSGVYVNADKLVECKTLSADCHKLSQMLLLEVFTINALSTCALPATLCKTIGAIREHDIPELNLHATETVLKFIAEYGLEKDWKVDDYGCIIKEIERNNDMMRWYGRQHAFKLILPPEYDANDSRWTLKYREPDPGLVELVEDSGVYINADKLAECKTLSKDCVTLARMLVNKIFTANALRACLMTNVTAGDPRATLDEHAMRILLKFVVDYGLQKDWKITDHKFIQNCIRQKIEVMRYVEWNKEKARNAPKNELYLRWTMRDSIWTLAHRLPYEREVELVEHSGVYVDADKLTACKKLSNDCITLALRLLTEVFKMSALRECSLSEKNRGIYETLPASNTRPHQRESCELDAHAEIILLHFVDEYGVKMGWPLLDFRCMRESMLKIIQEIQQEARVHFQFLRNLSERWTLQYREPAPGLAELIEHSGVYVDADKLATFNNTDSFEIIVPRLLDEVFTMYALGTCALPAALYNDIGIDVEPDRPELDLHATRALLDFVEECGEKQGRKGLRKRHVIALIHCRLEKERRRK